MIQSSVKALDRAIKRYGSKCYVWIKGSAFSGHSIRAFVEDNRRRSDRLSGSRFDPVGTMFGQNARQALCLYARYEPFWETDREIRIMYRDRMYTVDYDSVVVIADEPLYVWALLRPVAAPAEVDYGEDLDPEGGVYDGTGRNGGDLNE